MLRRLFRQIHVGLRPDTLGYGAKMMVIREDTKFTEHIRGLSTIPHFVTRMAKILSINVSKYPNYAIPL